MVRLWHQYEMKSTSLDCNNRKRWSGTGQQIKSGCSIRDLDNLSADPSVFEHQLPNRDRQLEPPRPRAARIEIKNAISHLLPRDVAVPRDHGREAGSFRLQIQLPNIVQHINRDAADLENVSFGQCAGPGSFVDVAADCRELRNCPQLIENLGLANIPGVDDVVRAVQGLHRLGTKQAVRVGNDANDDRDSQVSVFCSRAHQLVDLRMKRRAIQKRIRAAGLQFPDHLS